MTDFNFLIDLAFAYSNIESVYFNKSVMHHFNGELATSQDIERVVLAELYFQWRFVMTQKPGRYSSLILHSEIGKRVTNSGIQHPDLVLHGGQFGLCKDDYNKIFVELKMDEFIDEDIKKCLYSLTEPLNYSYAVCIVHNNKDFRQSILAKWELFAGYREVFEKFYFMNMDCRLHCLNDLVQNIQ